MSQAAPRESADVMERQSICFPNHATHDVWKSGDVGFKDEIRRLYDTAENNALEQLIHLKQALRQLPTDDFWAAVTEGMSQILGAEICFVMKRILVDDQESAVEMPPIGEPGSCLMAAALHYCASDGSKETFKSTKFHAYGCPCAYMRHDKVFVVPDRLTSFFNNNPNPVRTPCEAYIAVPLFEQGKCFAHFGAMWTEQGALHRNLSWAFIEMILHSLEDMIAQRFVQGTDFIKQSAAPNRIIPHDAVTLAQSLRPYAGSLSHELRTPMQGIVGMLDVMYATVQEAIHTQGDPRLRQVFQTLRDNIETVQDSSRRAVEAADNVVHAYDMDMSVPEPSSILLDDQSDSYSPFSPPPDKRPEILVAGSNLPLSRPNKRRREEGSSRGSFDTGPNKMPRLSKSRTCSCSEHDGKQEAQELDAHVHLQQHDATSDTIQSVEESSSAPGIPDHSSRTIVPGLRHTSLRELLQFVINEGLKHGGRPDSATAQQTERGEIIEVRTRGSDMTCGRKIIEWSVDPLIPSTMFIDEKDLSKLISCVFLNAIKFTDQSDGRVDVKAKMSQRGRYISIKIADNGPGIPSAFLPKLFKPFSQENGTITRSSEGLGLGLLVAKGIARKLGGDLMCTRAETGGPQRGTEFEIKVPLHAGEIISRPASPFGSPLPRRFHLNTDDVHPKPLPAAPESPRKLTKALHDAVDQPLSCASLPLLVPVSPNESPAKAASSSTSLPSPPAEPVKKSLAKVKNSGPNSNIDRDLANKYPLTFLVAEDNKINRKLLVSMLGKFGYKQIHEAHDGAEAVRQMSVARKNTEQIDVVLMDLWMPLMDGYEATERILSMNVSENKTPTVLAVTADVTDHALERAAEVGMKGFMTKPYKLLDLQRLITEYCASHEAGPHPVLAATC